MRLVAAIVICLTTPLAVADDAVERDEPTRTRRHDYSRFSDGPRRVPASRGAAKTRAEALGLGTNLTASRLLHGRPEPRWVEAAGGSMPEHLRWPVELGRFGRGFGYVRIRRPDLRHNGVDIVADEGSVVRAVADGIVAYSDNGVRGFGNMVMIVHPNGWVSMYAHNYRTTVQPGWRVRRGERIAFVGNTGISRGPHLHFELRINGRPTNPLTRFDGRPWIDAYRQWRAMLADDSYEEPTGHLQERLVPDRGPRRRAMAPGGIGTVTHLRARLRTGPSEDDLAAVEGEHYRNILWPLRGGTRARREGRGINVYTDSSAAVRAVADGLVVYVGDELRGMGKTVAILHANGWISLSGHCDDVHVEVGQQVERGSWIAHTSGHLHFQLRSEGRALSVPPLLVGVPDGIAIR
ncbi:MAG: M23 family metallopeptidase [Myxococcota bacterium]